MEFVAQKLGFLKNVEGIETNVKKRPSEAGTLDGEEVISKKRKLSSGDSSSSDSPNNNDLSFGRLRLSESDDEPAVIPPINRSYVSIPKPIRPTITSKTVLTSYEFQHLPQMLDLSRFIDVGTADKSKSQTQKAPLDNLAVFPPQQYLSFLFTTYGQPQKMIGNLTVQQRRAKVERYLEKKKSRQWKNVKYTVRQELAEGRKRVQGKFVKSERKWKWNEVHLAKNDEQKDS